MFGEPDEFATMVASSSALKTRTQLALASSLPADALSGDRTHHSESQFCVLRKSVVHIVVSTETDKRKDDGNMTQSRLDLRGRVAIVTGAGRGLGRAYARELAGRGASVVVNDLPSSKVSFAGQVVDEIVRDGGKAVSVEESVSSVEGGRRMVDMAVEYFGKVDIVVNNAGVIRWSPFASLSPASLDLILDSHVKGAYYVTQPAWSIMAEQGYGRVINTCSSVGVLGMDQSSAYATAKSGLHGLTKALAREGAGLGIHVNAIMPAAVTTDRHGDERNSGTDTVRLSAAVGELRSWMTPEYTAALVAFLASAECPLNGELVSSVGGHYACVATVLTGGWSSCGLPIAEDFRDHLDEVRDRSCWWEPTSAVDEVELVASIRNRT